MQIRLGSEVVRDFREWGLTTLGHVTAPFLRADPRAFARRSCGRKVVHPTEEVAEAARRLTEASTGDGRLHSDRCGFCAGWHVGHVARRPMLALDDRRDRHRRGRAQRRGRGPRWVD